MCLLAFRPIGPNAHRAGLGAIRRAMDYSTRAERPIERGPPPRLAAAAVERQPYLGERRRSRVGSWPSMSWLAQQSARMSASLSLVRVREIRATLQPSQVASTTTRDESLAVRVTIPFKGPPTAIVT